MSRYLNECVAIADVELRKLIRDPTELISRAIQPILWLVIFGQVLSHAHGIDTGKVGYLAFIDARDSGAECAVQCDLLRHRRDLGA